MSQTQIQTQTQIKQVLEELRKQLPMDVWAFKKMVEERLGCEFYFDESVEPKKEYNITRNVKVYVYDEEDVDIVCEEQTITLPIKNSVYVDNLKTNMIILVHYDL